MPRTRVLPPIDMEPVELAKMIFGQKDMNSTLAESANNVYKRKEIEDAETPSTPSQDG